MALCEGAACHLAGTSKLLRVLDIPSKCATAEPGPRRGPRHSPCCVLCRLWQVQNKMAAVGGEGAYDARLDRVAAARSNLEQRLQVRVFLLGVAAACGVALGMSVTGFPAWWVAHGAVEGDVGGDLSRQWVFTASVGVIEVSLHPAWMASGKWELITGSLPA